MVLRGSCGNVAISSFESFSVSFCVLCAFLPIQPETCEVLWVSLAVHELYQTWRWVGWLGFLVVLCCLQQEFVVAWPQILWKWLVLPCDKHGLGGPALQAGAVLRTPEGFQTQTHFRRELGVPSFAQCPCSLFVCRPWNHTWCGGRGWSSHSNWTDRVLC